MSPAHQHEDASFNVTGSSEATLVQPAPTPPQLVALRATIDNLDAVLVHVLAERFKCTRQVGELKRDLDLPAADYQREAQQIARLEALARDSGLDPVFAQKFFNFIVSEVIRHHEAIKEGA